MIAKVSQKINQSSMQVLKTLKVILQGDYSMQEILKIINRNEPEEIFNNSVVSKYINTCRYTGIEIPKINNKYILKTLPFGIDLSLEDMDILKMLQAIIEKDMSESNLFTFKNFQNKLNKYSNKKLAPVDKKVINPSYELFERAVAKKRKVKLIFRNQSELVCIPLKIGEMNGKTFFYVYNKRTRIIDRSRITGVELLDTKFVDPLNGEQVAIYKLTGGLAKRYSARENESVDIMPDGSIIVTNKNENKDMLLSRLLRYQDSCELLKPKAYRDEFKQLIIDTLNNYGIK